MTSRFGSIIALMALFGVIIAGNLGGWELRGSDEPRYGQIAREMLETGQYIVPHLNAEHYPDKPPLLFWLMALAGMPVDDVSAFAARLPSALASLGMILLTYIFAARLFDRSTGLLAGAVLFCCEQFFSKAISAHFDTLLAFWTTLSILLFYTGYTARENGKKHMLGAYAAMGCALITKGPVGLVIPLLAMLLFIMARKEFGRIRELHLGKGILIAMGIIAAWLIPACLMGGEAYTQNILFKQTFGRAVGSFAHKEPFFYYLINFPIDFLPWSLFLPAAAAYLWKHRSRDRNILLPTLWFAGTFVFFSLVSGKRSLYLLPLFPAAAILMARFLGQFISSDETYAELSRSKLFTVPCYILAGAIPAAGAVGIVMLAGNIGPVQTFTEGRWALFAVACCALAAGAAWFQDRNEMRRLKRIPYMVVACVAAVYGLWSWIMMPAIGRALPERSFCESILKAVRPEDRLYATFPPAFLNYFLHRYPIPEVRNVEALERLLESPQRIFCLAKERDYESLPEDFRNRVLVVEKSPIGHKTILLLSNRATGKRLRER